MRSGPLPDVFTFLSYRQYLEAWFAARKAADRRFSHRWFARRAGATSPSLLAEVVSGKRNLSPVMVDGFVEALGLGVNEASFFRDLVTLDQGPTEAERNAAWERLSAHRRFQQARPIDGPAFAFLSTWYIPATRELASRRDFRPDPAWIAAELEPRITEAQAAHAVSVLRELGLWVERDGRTVLGDVTVATPHQVMGLAVHNYHRQMLERAVDAIEHVRSVERHVVGVTVAVPEALVPELKAELDRFQERLLHLCDARLEAAGGADRVYQVELCLFPLSRGPQ